jgi:hypothetical protein
MTWPVVPNTALLGDADLHIRNLAEAIDRQLGVSYKFATMTGNVTVDSAGNVAVQFPLTTIAGCIIQNATRNTSYGQREYLDPVPPSTIGRLIGMTYQMIYPIQFSGGTVACATRTSVWSGTRTGSQPNVVPWWGSQPCQAGDVLTVTGLAWGS